MDKNEIRTGVPKAFKKPGDIVYMSVEQSQKELMKERGVDPFVFNNMISWTILAVDESSGNYIMKPLDKPELGLTYGDKTYMIPIEIVNELQDRSR